MEKTERERLIEFAGFYFEKLMKGEALNDEKVVDEFLSINCLEAKPKALHSMKEDENECHSCGDSIPKGLKYCRDCFW